MVPVTPSTLVVHETKGLKKSAGEVGDRKLCLDRLPDDDPSGVRFQVCVHHPEFVVTPTGRYRQDVEIVYRSNDEDAAKNAYATYCKLLGGTPPKEFEPKASAVASAASPRVLELEKELGRVLARLDELESRLDKKK